MSKKRILLKISGEFLKGNDLCSIDPSILDMLAKEICEIVSDGSELAIVIGGGNLFRGEHLSKSGIGRITGDHMGMLATMMNGLALRDALERIDLPSIIMSSIPMTGVIDTYNRRKAINNIRSKKVVIFTGGIGNPLFTTDTAACLRAIEVNADIVLKATNVDGVYNKDPKIFKDAIKYDFLEYDNFISQELKVLDLTAICLCKTHKMPIFIFNINEKGAVRRILMGEKLGTLISSN